MTYNKPEVLKLNSAVSSIQGVGKDETEHFDVTWQLPNAASMNAYESDD